MTDFDTDPEIAKIEKKVNEHRKNVNKTIKEMISKIRKDVIQLYVNKESNKVCGHIANNILYYSKYMPKIYTIRKDKDPEMYIYDNGIYLPEARTYIAEICEQILGRLYRKSLLANICAIIEAKTFIDQDEFYREENPRYLPVKNGILDLMKKKLMEYDPNKRFFTKLDIKYNPKKDCPEFKKFVSEILPIKQDMIRSQEVFGMCLYRRQYLHKAIMWTGIGRNGKGQLANILKVLLHPDNVSSVGLQEMESDRFATADLHKKLANIAEEISARTISNSSIFKSVTGGDRIRGQQKFCHAFNFEPYATMIFLCNEVPASKDQTDAFFARWEVFDFPFQFLPQKDIDERVAAGESVSKFKVQDPNRIQKIFLLDELPGVLNWALEGLHRVLKNKHFSHSATVDQTRRWYLEKSDPFRVFLQECVQICDLDQGYIVKSDLRRRFLEWKKSNRVRRVVTDKYMKLVLDQDYGVEEKQVRISKVSSERERRYYGIVWKSLSQPAWVEQRKLPLYKKCKIALRVKNPVPVVPPVPVKKKNRAIQCPADVTYEDVD